MSVDSTKPTDTTAIKDWPALIRLIAELVNENEALLNEGAWVKYKNNVAAMTVANIVLSGAQTVDGVSLVDGNRCLVKNQTDASENGIYDVSTGAWTRSTDADTGIELIQSVCQAEGGTVHSLNKYICTNTSITLETTDLIYEAYLQISPASITVAGLVELLTDAEIKTGTDTSRAATAANIAALFAAPHAIGSGTPAAGAFTTLSATGLATLQAISAQAISGTTLTASGLATLAAATLSGILTLNGTLAGSGFLDEDDFASDAADKVASQQSIGARIVALITNGSLAGSFTTLAASGAISPADGIAFPATAVPSADPNTLDDYEEGTYTAIMTCSTSGTVTLSGSAETLGYTKIGNVVSITGEVDVASVSSPIGIPRLSLPFTTGAPINKAGYFSGAVFYNNLLAVGDGGSVMCYAAHGLDTIDLYEMSTTTALDDLAAHMQATTELVFSFNYHI